MASIAEFFAGQNVFITGISGFLGKVLVEKLLRSCPDVEAIYVLVRDKKGTSAVDRLNAILAQKLFSSLQQTNPSCFAKVKLISGDLQRNDIIIKDEDRQIMCEKINVVIHTAATVRFTEPLRNSVDLNLRATFKMLELATDMRNLKAFVHVSTAYSNCNLREIGEQIYPCDVEPRQVMSLCNWMADDLLEHLCPKLLKDRPNTYIFTKALTENLVAEYTNKLPLAIVRPSIITGAANEPLPGWVDNYNGPSGLMIAFGTGVLTTLYTDLDCVADLIPVDFVANAVLAAAYRVGEGFRIYNVTSGSENPIKWRMFVEQSIDYPHQFPSMSIVRYPQPRITSNKLVHRARLFLQHYVPAHLIDAILRCTGRKPMMSRLYERLASSIGLLEYFSTNEWHFDNTNTRELFRKLSASDQAEFNFSVASVDWPTYVLNYCHGVRHYVLGETADLEKAKRHLTRMKYVDYATNVVLAVGVWKTLCIVLPCSEMTGLC